MRVTLTVILIINISISASAQDSIRYAHAAAAPKTQDLKKLVRYLEKGTRDDSLVVLTFSYWITQNIAYNMSMKGNATAKGVSVEGVLKYKNTVCAGYANLFKAMCDAAKIKCEIVEGIGQNYNDAKTGKTDHAWNTVYLNGKWYLFDVTWATGASHDGTFVRRLDSEYLYADPKLFLINHFPEDSKWQLQDPPITLEQFFSPEWDRKRLRYHYKNFSKKQFEKRMKEIEQDSVQMQN